MRELTFEERKELVNNAVEIIKRINEQAIANHKFMNMVYIFKSGKGVGLPIEFEEPEEKDALFRGINQNLKKYKPDFAIFTAESWFVTRPADNMADIKEDDLPLPSECPDRREAYTINARTDGFSRMIILPFTRLKDGSIQFEEEIEYNSADNIDGYDKLFNGVFTDGMETIGGIQ